MAHGRPGATLLLYVAVARLRRGLESPHEPGTKVMQEPDSETPSSESTKSLESYQEHNGSSEVSSSVSYITAESLSALGSEGRLSGLEARLEHHPRKPSYTTMLLGEQTAPKTHRRKHLHRSGAVEAGMPFLARVQLCLVFV